MEKPNTEAPTQIKYKTLDLPKGVTARTLNFGPPKNSLTSNLPTSSNTGTYPKIIQPRTNRHNKQNQETVETIRREGELSSSQHGYAPHPYERTASGNPRRRDTLEQVTRNVIDFGLSG